MQYLTLYLQNLRQLLEEALDDVATELNQLSTLSYRQYVEITRAIDRKLSSKLYLYERLKIIIGIENCFNH